jgi:glyoxylase-like metal-dependent hydrolase (beta-lactamase superfamily II)
MDVATRGTPDNFLPKYDAVYAKKHMSWLAPTFLNPVENKLILSFHSWILKTHHHTIVVDTCIGNDKERPLFPPMHRLNKPWMTNFQATGVKPEDVDLVMCTHLHADHCGWNTRLENGKWVPTFPNARYLFSRKEVEHADPRGKPEDPAHDHNHRAFMDSVLPILEAKKAVLVDGVHEIDDELRIEPAPGQTPGHMTLRLKTGGREGLFTGDVLHHPLQVYRPEWSSSACLAPDQSARTRRRILEENADRDVTFFPCHFGAPFIGRVVSTPDSFAFKFI